jgi:hypothetical protein
LCMKCMVNPTEVKKAIKEIKDFSNGEFK